MIPSIRIGRKFCSLQTKQLNSVAPAYFRKGLAKVSQKQNLPESTCQIKQHRNLCIQVCMAQVNGVGEKRKMVKIGTHSGSFHCDEALGCWMLKQTKQFKDADIVRTRNQDELKDLDIIIDVGGEYNPESNRYDHHQREFKEVFGHGFNTKLSSAGLVYKHFGKELLQGILGLTPDHPDLELMYLTIYKHFIEAVDAIDNGVDQYDTDKAPRYLNHTGLGPRVGALNLRWNDDWTNEKVDAQFQKAMELTGREFSECLDYYYNCWLPARAIVQRSIEARSSVDASGKIVKLEKGCPWKEHLYTLEEELGIQGELLYMLYENEAEQKWRIQAVPVEQGKFEDRKSLPKEWRGLRDEELSKVADVPGCTFVHSSGFTGGNATYDGVVLMAQKAIETQ